MSTNNLCSTDNPINYKKLLQSGIIAIVLNIALSLVITFYLKPAYPSAPLAKLFAGVMLVCLLITIFSVMVDILLEPLVRDKTLVKALLIMVPLTLIAALIASFIGLFIMEKILGLSLLPSIVDYMGQFLVPIGITNIIITLISTVYRWERNKKEQLEKHLHAIQSDMSIKNEPVHDHLQFREKGSQYRLPYKDIIYLSSHGKKTIVHSEEKAWEISIIMKDIEAKLPRQMFMRIHKQFIVNMQYVARIQYYLGGRYILYLKDSDSTTLPIGITYTKEIKQWLGL